MKVALKSMNMDSEQNLSSFPLEGFEALLEKESIPSVHAKSVFKWHYQGLNNCWKAHPTIPKKLKALLGTFSNSHTTSVSESHQSKYDNSVKFVIELWDKQKVEAVLMPERNRVTLCLSTQVGCRQACRFCHTGRMGLIRNLMCSEIIGQVLSVERWIKENSRWLEKCQLPTHQRVTHIVFMGMGEPLDNTFELIQAIKILTQPHGLGIPLRKISVSTAGHIEGLKQLHSVFPNIPIAFSMHCVENKKRSVLMPINKEFPLADVLNYLQEHYSLRSQKPFIQFTLIKGVNDDLETAKKLAELTKPLDPKINLIPLNQVSPSRLEAPSPETLQAFRDELHTAGIRVMIRYSKGQDIGGACGQLITNKNQ